MRLLLSVYTVLSMMQATTVVEEPVVVEELFSAPQAQILEPEVKGVETQVNSSDEGYQQKIISQINDFRNQNGLSSVSMRSEVCAFAATRANEIQSDFSHQPFFDRIDAKTLPYSGYSLVTENLAETNDENKVVQLWIDSGTHNENMRKDTPYVCVVRAGNFYAYAGWKP